MQPYDCKVTIRSRPSTIMFIKERLSKTNKRLKLFKDTVFGKYLDLDVEDNDNHLLNYVLHHQRPELSKSIDSNLIFDIAGDTLLFGRSEFCLVTGFACGKVVFPKYMDDGIPPFLRRLFPDKAKKKLENKASLGKAAQGKAAQGKAAKGKVAIGKAVKETLTSTSRKRILLNYQRTPYTDLLGHSRQILESFPNSYHWWSKESEVIPRCLAWTKREGFEKQNYPHLFGLVDDQNGFTRNDEPEAKQDGSGALDRASAGAKVEETKSIREVALEEELDLWRSRYIELESYYKNLEASVDIARKNSHGLSFLTPNAKATSVCDGNYEADVAADDNAKATSVHDDVGAPDAATDDNATSVYDDIDEKTNGLCVGLIPATDDNQRPRVFHRMDVGVYRCPQPYDNAKATSVCDDINEADAAADDNAKATSVHDDVGVPDAAVDDNAKATSVCDDINEADAAADDNAKATSVHDDVGVPDATADDNAKAMSVCDDIDEADAAADDNAKAMSVHNDVGDLMPQPMIMQSSFTSSNSFPESYKRFQRSKDKNTHPQISFGLFKSSKEDTSLVSLGNGLNVDEKFWQSLVARDATSRGSQAMALVMWHFRPKHAGWAISSLYYCNLPTPNDLGDWIFKDITYPVGSALNLGKAECSNCVFLAEKIKALETKIKILEATLGNASRGGENHTRESALILHELYNDIGKLGLE
ncbi:hypothetical protein Tco_0199384 [Tanacetum coccineum]